MRRSLPLLLLFFLSIGCIGHLFAQGCTTIGQTPQTAFPVCGDSIFTQTTVPPCTNGVIPTKCPPAAGITYDDRNPFWYKFTCYQTGTLGFLITPLDINDDYDWQIFDITGRDINDLYKDASMILCYNWSGLTGITGASTQGTSQFECATSPGFNPPKYSSMPTIIAGHEYVLMIGHFTAGSQSGYQLQFGGGTGSIVNPVIPKIQRSRGICDGQEIAVKLTSKIRCVSIAADGSDFAVTGPVTRTVVSARGYGCSAGFDTDSIILHMNDILVPGTYTITAKIGTDGNTLTDNCNNQLVPGDKTNITFVPPAPVPMDSIVPVVCIQDTLQLVFARPMRCSSVAPDGSDFKVTGPVAVTVQKAEGICFDGLTTTIRVILTKPIRVNGNFTVTLGIGSDGNSLIDECDQVTPAGETVSFTTKNITTADFIADIRQGCRFDTAYFSHNAYGGTTQWNWMLDSVPVSTQQNHTVISKDFGPHKMQLAVYNGFCRDTVTTAFTFIDQTVKASFQVADTLCPTDTLHFTDQSTPNTVAWFWNFGNGVTSSSKTPAAQSYPMRGRQASYNARLTAQNKYGCRDTAYKIVTVLGNCYIAVASAFTPNGDGLNDYLYPLNAFKADNLLFRVFNRYGQLIFQTTDWTRKWDGRYQGNPQPSGTYVWMLDYTNRDDGKKISLKGTSVLIR